MLKLFKSEWILIDCQCFIIQTPEIKEDSKSDSNDIVIVTVMVFTTLFSQN